jgi:acetyl-CoA carboxylase carboxyltransferase component
MLIREKLKELKDKSETIKLGGGKGKIEKQHTQGKLTARERIDLLLDRGSFVELGAFQKHRATEFGLDKREIPCDGVVTGYGTINGRLVFVYAQDFTTLGGSLGETHAKKICQLMDQAGEVGAPIIGLNDSGGARIQEGIDALKGYGEIFYRNTRLSGIVPQLTAIMGPCAGGAVYSPAIGDFILMTERTSFMYITGPAIVKTVLGTEVSHQELGGSLPHSTESGMAHLVGRNDKEVIELIKKLLSYLPSNYLEDLPRIEAGDDPARENDLLYDIIPTDPKKSYDARDLIKEVVDNKEFLEIHPDFAPNIVVGFARLDGRSVGIVANNPEKFAGVLDINSADKASRFVRFCDAFNIPILTFMDVPGFMPGIDQEHGGIIRHGAKLLFAYSEATIPLLTVIVRKAYGGAYIGMASKHLGADCVFALPTAEVAVMGPEGACEIIFREEIKKAGDPKKKREELIEDYRKRFANPYKAAERGYVDEVIDPRYLRKKLVNALRVYESKKESLPRKKHSNIPL